MSRYTKASDNFNRADEAITASGDWTAIAFGDPDGEPEIISNVVTQAATNSGYDRYLRWDSDTFADDQWAEIDVTISDTSITDQASAAVRMPGSGHDSSYALADAYLGVWDNNGGGSNGRLRIVKVVNDSFTALATTTSIAQTGTKTLRLEVVGMTLTLYVDDVSTLTYSEAWEYTTGRPGMHMWTTATPAVSADNWSAGDWVLPAPQNLVLDYKDADQIDMSWDAVSGATGYDVRRDGTTIATNVATTSYSDTGLAAATEYTHEVRARKV